MKNALAKKKLAILGVGKIGGILLEAFLKQKLVSPQNIAATVHRPERVQEVARQFKVRVSTDNRAAVRTADVILICVKPQTVDEVLDEIRPEVTPAKLIISVAASVPTSYIQQKLQVAVPVIRAMPNTPASVGCGMTGLCKGGFAREKHIQIAHALFDCVGRTIEVEERQMDAVTGLSASGPAYIYIILESLAEAGVKVGLSREVATLLAAQTALGAARVVLDSGHHPALLKDMVTTPAGCTIDGILELEEGKLRVTLIKAVVKATQRASELHVLR
ncbi:MAG TPA: pyrroline-5-carboxylate reductase [Terriglobales bacterium]|nr:pyrroline-5-carboxylate reductase [Terriglobales bacterium]